MNTVRPLVPSDMDRVVVLHRQAFGAKIEEARLRVFLQRILFEHPWQDPAFPSLGWIGQDGELAGCLGVMPRPMRLGDESVRAVITHDFIVAPGRRGGLAAIQMLRALHDRRPDVALADENETSRRLSEALGSVAIEARSRRWLRAFRPGRLALHLFEKRRGGLPRPMRGILGGLTSLPDVLLGRVPGSPTRTPRVARDVHAEGNPDPAALAEVIDRLTRGFALRPVYTPDTLHWLLETLRATGRDQVLRTAIVRSGAEAVGWYVYYSRPGRVGQVLQIGAAEASRGKVLDHLFADAADRGNAGLSGQVDPVWRRHLEEASSTIRPGSTWLTVQTARPDLRRAIATSDAFLSRLESEAWLHFAS